MPKSINKNRNKKHKGGERKNQRQLVFVNRGPGFAPPRTRTVLTFSKVSILSNVGATFSNVVFSPTNVFDVDPVLGSTVTPGFNEYAAMYRQYRVNSSKIKVGFNNEETKSVTIYVVPVNYNPGANNTTPLQYLSDRLAKTKIIGGNVGNSSALVTHRATTQQFGGVKYTGQEDPYSSVVTGSPANNWFWMIGCVTSNSVLTTSGVSFYVHIDIEVEFYELNNPSG